MKTPHFGNVHTDSLEASAGLTIVTVRMEVVFTHMPLCVCVCETEMVGRCLVGRNVGVWACDRQEGSSSRMKNQQQTLKSEMLTAFLWLIACYPLWPGIAFIGVVFLGYLSVTFLWPARGRLEGMSSNSAQTFTWPQGWAGQILGATGQGLGSLTSHQSHACERGISEALHREFPLVWHQLYTLSYHSITCIWILFIICTPVHIVVHLIYASSMLLFFLHIFCTLSFYITTA